MKEIIKLRFMILVIRYMRKLALTDASYLHRQGEKIERDIAYQMQEEISEGQISKKIASAG